MLIVTPLPPLPPTLSFSLSLDKSSEYQGTGSRFQHAEKLQFAQEDDGPQVEEASEEVSKPVRVESRDMQTLVARFIRFYPSTNSVQQHPFDQYSFHI